MLEQETEYEPESVTQASLATQPSAGPDYVLCPDLLIATGDQRRPRGLGRRHSGGLELRNVVTQVVPEASCVMALTPVQVRSASPCWSTARTLRIQASRAAESGLSPRKKATTKPMPVATTAIIMTNW